MGEWSRKFEGRESGVGTSRGDINTVFTTQVLVHTFTVACSYSQINIFIRTLVVWHQASSESKTKIKQGLRVNNK